MIQDQKSYRREYYLKNKDKFLGYATKWREKNKEAFLEIARRFYHRHKDRLLSGRKEYQAEYRKLHKETNRAYKKEYYQKNKAKLSVINREWAKNNPERMKQLRQMQYEKHREKLSLKSVQYRKRNKETIRARSKAWKINNTHKIREYSQKRRDVQIGVCEKNPKQIIRMLTKVYASPSTRCFYCDTPLYGKKIHIDHIVPLAKGGSHSTENLCASCPECNLSKGSKTFEEWFFWKLTVGKRLDINKNILTEKGNT